MFQAQTRQAIASLSLSLFAMFQQLGFTDNKLDSIQESLDNLVAIANDKTKDAVQEIVVSVSPERKERRKKEKEVKDNKKEKDVIVEHAPTEAVAKSSKPKRVSKRASPDE